MMSATMRVLSVVTAGLLAAQLCSAFLSSSPSIQPLKHGRSTRYTQSLSHKRGEFVRATNLGERDSFRGSGALGLGVTVSGSSGSSSGSSSSSGSDPKALGATARSLGGGGGSPWLVRDVMRTKAASSALQAASGAGDEGEYVTNDRSALRRNILLAVWLSLALKTATAAQPWNSAPPLDVVRDFELAQQLFDGGGNVIYFSVFNSLGLIGPIFISTLIGGGAFKGGKQPVPAEPFVFGSFAMGFYALGPYLALRKYYASGDGDEPSLLENVFTSKFTGLALLSGALYCYITGIPALFDPVERQGYADLFNSYSLVHFSSLDLTILSASYVDPLREDMQRRGVAPDVAKVAVFALPIIGPALWLVLRPAVVVVKDA